MDDMRMHAIRDEQIRKQNQKEQGLPSFSELERQPLTAGGADKDEYVTYEDDRVGRMPGGMPPQGQAGRNGLARDGSVLNGVGVGYGRRTPRDEQQQGGHTLGYGGGYAPSMISSAGAAGVGAGGGGVERAPQNNCQSALFLSPTFVLTSYQYMISVHHGVSLAYATVKADKQTTTTPTLIPARTNQHTTKTPTAARKTTTPDPIPTLKPTTVPKAPRALGSRTTNTPRAIRINRWNRRTMVSRTANNSRIPLRGSTRMMHMAGTNMIVIKV